MKISSTMRRAVLAGFGFKLVIGSGVRVTADIGEMR